ncbi:MAG TPA: hypothetical protein PK562_05560, partial [Candidatus Omnitrophota bacterium]|nr:hypothetical protein [Candidatus Omnitrophota bacterium]
MASPQSRKECVFIVDTIGELLSYYAVSDVVFVGGSLVSHGGQNFLEPAFLAKPVIVGPSLFNFRDIARQFLDQGAAVMVGNAGELSNAVRTLLADERKAAELVRQASRLIQENRGATERNLSYIKEFIRIEKS